MGPGHTNKQTKFNCEWILEGTVCIYKLLYHIISANSAKKYIIHSLSTLLGTPVHPLIIQTANQCNA